MLILNGPGSACMSGLSVGGIATMLVLKKGNVDGDAC